NIYSALPNVVNHQNSTNFTEHSSYNNAANGDFRDSDRRLGITDRRPLSVLAARAYGETEVGTDLIYGHKHLRPIPRERGTAHRFTRNPIFYQIPFTPLEYEITIHRIYLASAHFFDEKALRCRTQNFCGIRPPRNNHRIRHSRDWPVLV